MTDALTAMEAQQLALDIGEAELGKLDGQTLAVLKELQAALFDRAGPDLGPEKFGRLVYEAVELISTARTALNPASRPDWHHDKDSKLIATEVLEKRLHGKSPTQVIWPFPDIYHALFSRADRGNNWEHDQEQLRSAANDYLTKFWDHSPTLERIFISALAYTEAQAFVLSQLRPRDIFALVRPTKRNETAFIVTLGRRAGWKALRRGVWRVLVALIPAFLLGGKYGMEVGLTTFLAFQLFYGLLSAVRSKVSPDPFLNNLTICNELADVSKLASKSPQVPTALRIQMETTSAKGAVWPQELWQFVLRAEDRCRWTLDSKSGF